MKRHLVLIFAAAFTITNISCGNDDDDLNEYEKQFQGLWELYDAKLNPDLEFPASIKEGINEVIDVFLENAFSDNTPDVWYRFGPGNSMQESGTQTLRSGSYRAAENWLRLTFTHPKASRENLRYKITGNTLEIIMDESEAFAELFPEQDKMTVEIIMYYRKSQ